MKAAKLEARLDALEVASRIYNTAIVTQGAQLQSLVKLHTPGPKAAGFTAGDYAEMIAAGVLLALALYWLFSSPSE